MVPLVAKMSSKRILDIPRSITLSLSDPSVLHGNTAELPSLRPASVPPVVIVVN